MFAKSVHHPVPEVVRHVQHMAENQNIVALQMQNLKHGDVLQGTALSIPVTIQPIRKEPRVHIPEIVVHTQKKKRHSVVIQKDVAEALSVAYHVILVLHKILNVIHLMQTTTANGHMTGMNAKQMTAHHHIMNSKSTITTTKNGLTAEVVMMNLTPAFLACQLTPKNRIVTFRKKTILPTARKIAYMAFMLLKNF